MTQLVLITALLCVLSLLSYTNAADTVAAPGNGADPILLGEIIGTQYGISGTVIVLSENSVKLQNFKWTSNFNAFFWLYESLPARGGFKIPDETGSLGSLPSRPYPDMVNITIVFPGDTKITDSNVAAFGIWCVSANQDFGSIAIPSDLNPAPAGSNTPRITDGFENCEALDDRLNVYWTVDGSNVNILLSGVAGSEDYMAFGIPSSIVPGEQMIGSDIVVAQFENNAPKAEDYFIASQRAPCTNGGTTTYTGVCPDVKLNMSQNAVTNVDGELTSGGILFVKYTRPLAAIDPNYDNPINISNPDQPIVWALGPIDTNVRRPRIHSRRGPSTLHFGRTPALNCAPVEIPTTDIGPGWVEQSLPASTTDFKFVIGPSGGAKGYGAITGNPAWGISWYINDVLIPTLTLTRGVEYTFTVAGGNNASVSAEYHPLYFTTDKNGGRSILSAAQRQAETVIAGVDSNEMPEYAGHFCAYKSDKTQDEVNAIASFDDFFPTLDALSCQSGSPVTFKFTPDASTPDLIYYQCWSHTNLGSMMKIVDAGDNNTPSSAVRYGFSITLAMLLVVVANLF